ncbi:MAG: YcfL family protein [Verrucomicrobia bacterium]|jgi:uncharacterized protein YcfL|nr:YcfL family protein [Verrucomicrobiota bacterium]
MKTTSLTLLALGAAILLAAAGCRSTAVNTVEPASPTAPREMISDKRVLTDQTLNNIVRIVGLNAAMGDEGFLKVQVEVENRTRRARSFTYQVEWFDEHGMIIDSPIRVARPRTIEAREVLLITATAPTPRAKDFRIKFLEPTTE